MKTKTIKQSLIAISACLLSSIGFSQNTCSFFSEQYSATTGWTTVHPVTNCPGPVVTINSGRFNYNSCSGGEQNRMYRNISFPANSWIADFDFFLNNAAGTYAPSEILAAFTAGTQDPYNTVTTACNGGVFPATSQDAIMASLMSNPNNTGWNFVAGSKDANNPWSLSVPIPCPIATATYYIRLQRLNQSRGLISVFTNAARTNHLAGSPQCFTITGSITNINTLQHGTIPQGGQTRTLNGSIDNMCFSKLLPAISGPSQAGCAAMCNFPIYTYTVVNVIGATYTAASWTLPVGATNISYSANFSSVSFTFPCPGSIQTVSCNPTFGSGVPCTITLTKNVTVVGCRMGYFENENEISQSDNLYPNPNNGTFTFNYEVPEGSNASLEIMDLMGRKISSYELGQGENTLEVNQSALEQGIYLYSIVKDGQIIKTDKLSVIK